MNKINANIERDHRQHKELIDLGWKVIVIWECELKHEKQNKTLFDILKRLKQEHKDGN